MATSAGEGTSYQGGAGGKFRKKPFKKPQTMPYDRPPTALRNPSWVTKMIIDPASKLISAGANLFFTPLYRKRLPPPPLPQGANQESKVKFQETAIHNPVGNRGKTHYDHGKQVLSEEQGLDIKVGENQKKSTDNNGLSELEIMLRQKTFTRSEIDRLTELLHSKTVESPNNNGKISKFRPQEIGSALQQSDSFARSSLYETRNESHIDNCAYDGRVSTALVSSKVCEGDFASPIELAKAYMGNSSSEVPPSALGSHRQAIREDSAALCNSPFAPQSTAISLVQKPFEHVGLLENGFATPRLRGRSAIYSMARTPYSKVHPTTSYKGNSSIYNGYGEPSVSSPNGFARELVARSVSKDLALKRRSSVLDDEIGSIGPIRRLRQKTNLSTPSNMATAKTPFSSIGTEIVSNGSLDPSSSSKTFQKSEDNESMPGTRYTPVPSQSKETARKILQQLQMLSPKEKQFEGKNSALGEKTPSKLTSNMLHGQALRSLENIDSSKILQGAGYSLNNKQKDPLADKCESSSQRQDKKVAENGPKSLNVSQVSLVPAGTSNGSVLLKGTVPASSLSDSVKKQAATNSSPKKWGFQMSAHEDFFDLDDEIPSSGDAVSAELPEEKKISETPVVDNKVVPVTEDKTSVSEFKASAVSFETGKNKVVPVTEDKTNLGTSEGTKMVEKNSGFMFSAAPVASPSFPSFSPVVSVSQPEKFAENIPEKEPKASSVLSSSSAKIDEKSSPFAFPSSPYIGGSVDLKSTSPAEVKPKTTNSLATNASATLETVTKLADSDNDAKNTQKPEDSVKKSGTLSSMPQSTSSFFSVGSKRSFSSPSEASLNSPPPSVFSLPIPTNSTSNRSPFTSFGFSTSSSSAPSSEASPSTSAISSSVLAPIFKFDSKPNDTASTAPSAPTFNFGLTPISTASTTTSTTPTLNTTTDFKSGSLFVAPSTYSTVSTTSATDVKASTEKECSLGNPPSNPFSVTSFPNAGTGSSIFGFSASTTPSSSAPNPSQSSLFGTSIVTAVSTQSMPVLGSSSTSSTFATGSSLFSSSTSSSSVFGNSTTGGFAFGSNSTSSTSLFSSSTPSNSLFSPSTSNIASSSSFGVVTSASSSTSFVFGAPPSQTSAFGSTASAASSPSFFSFNSAPQSQSVFGSTVVPAFGSAPGGSNGDQMTMAEDSMAEDQIQAGPPPIVPVFGQTQIQNPSSNPFMFGQTPPPSTGAVHFQFGGQPSPPNPFLPSGNSLDFGGGGSSFSLGSGGGGDDKSGRRTVRVKRTGRRK